MSDIAKSLLRQDHVFLIAPAGCGKTQTIAEMVNLSTVGVQLILTHTHAGVQSLRSRLNKLGVNRKRYELDTIAGWALRIANCFPQTANFAKGIPEDKADYQQIYAGATKILHLQCMRRVIRESYSGVVVDEYQDCTKRQHELIMSFAKILPCRILGDPLQGIFGFDRNDPLVSWETDIKPNFAEVAALDTPYRWIGTNKNEALGNWLLGVRKLMVEGREISLRNAPVEWVQNTTGPRDVYKKCFEKVNMDGTIAIIHPGQANQCHDFASRLEERYQSIEEVEAKDLREWAGKFDSASGNQRAVRIVEFAAVCITAVSTQLETIKGRFETSATPDFSRVKRHTDVGLKLVSIAKRTGFDGFVEMLKLIQAIDDAHLYRADLWHGMLNALKLYSTGDYPSLKDAAWHSRQREKFWGRREYPRIVSRTLLIKGLEYDHAIVLDADKFNVKNLYVALTRGSRSLTIISSEQRLSPKEDR